MIRYNQTTNLFDVTCDICKETTSYKTKKFAIQNDSICLFCKKYPDIKLIKGVWCGKCKTCDEWIPRKSRRCAISRLNLNHECHICAAARSRNEDTENNHNELIRRGSKHLKNGRYLVPCPICKTMKKIYYAHDGVDFVNRSYRTRCSVCTSKEYQRTLNSVEFFDEEETWKVIPSKFTPHSPLYSVSNFGNVRNNKSGRILSPLHNKKTGYMTVFLGWIKKRNGKKKACAHYVHRLVAHMFIPKIVGKNVVNHINHNKKDCRYFNLEWVTAKENVRKAALCGKYI